MMEPETDFKKPSQIDDSEGFLVLKVKKNLEKADNMRNVIITSLSTLGKEDNHVKSETEYSYFIDRRKICKRLRYTNESVLSYFFDNNEMSSENTDFIIFESENVKKDLFPVLFDGNNKEYEITTHEYYKEFISRNGFVVDDEDFVEVDYNITEFDYLAEKIFAKLKNDDNLYIDLSGGFRGLSIVLLVLCDNLKYRNINIKELATSTRVKSADDSVYIGTVASETSTKDILNLTNGVRRFTETGNSDLLEECLECMESKETEELKDSLHNYSSSIIMIDLKSYEKNRKELIEKLNNWEIAYRNKNRSIYESCFYNTIPSIIDEFFNTEVEGIRSNVYIQALDWCIKNKMLSQALSIYNEKIPELYYSEDYLMIDETGIFKIEEVAGKIKDVKPEKGKNNAQKNYYEKYRAKEAYKRLVEFLYNQIKTGNPNRDTILEPIKGSAFYEHIKDSEDFLNYLVKDVQLISTLRTYISDMKSNGKTNNQIETHINEYLESQIADENDYNYTFEKDDCIKRNESIAKLKEDINKLQTNNKRNKSDSKQAKSIILEENKYCSNLNRNDMRLRALANYGPNELFDIYHQIRALRNMVLHANEDQQESKDVTMEDALLLIKYGMDLTLSYYESDEFKPVKYEPTGNKSSPNLLDLKNKYDTKSMPIANEEVMLVVDDYNPKTKTLYGKINKTYSSISIKDDLSGVVEEEIKPGVLLYGKVNGLYQSKYRVVINGIYKNVLEKALVNTDNHNIVQPIIGDYVDFVVERKTSNRNWKGRINGNYLGRIDKNKTKDISISSYINKKLHLKIIDYIDGVYILDFNPDIEI